jgi:(p)ppGpp synthase/HD superfamily hydrolase
MTTENKFAIDDLLNPDFNSLTIEKAKDYAILCHNQTNHTYNGLPYYTHLKIVYDYGCRFSNLLDSNKIETALASCWLHDTIEDCRQTYNDVLKIVGVDIANVVFALTNEKGKTREERANDKYYDGIIKMPPASFVKICDRLANVYYSKRTESRMMEVYRQELDSFKSKLWNDDYMPMFTELDNLVIP